MPKNNNKELSFEDRLEEIQSIINRKKKNWRLTSVAWEDCAQEILIRVNNKYHTYDPKKGPFSHWLSRLITNALKNIIRDNYLKFNRPCVNGCPKNLGGYSCEITPSKLQDCSCPLYAKWQKKKESEFNIKQNLAIENHINEVHNIQNNFLDIGEAKKIIDEKMKDKLTIEEYKYYTLLYIDNLEPKEAGKILGFKTSNNSEIPGYQVYLKTKKKIIIAAQQIIEEEGLE